MKNVAEKSKKVDAPTLKIMVVDDHEVVRLGVGNVLDRVPGYHVVAQAASCQEVMETLKTVHPDLILLDVRLPDEDGFATCEKVLAKYPDCRILFLTSYASPDLVQKAVMVGAYGYVLKAVGSKSLLESVAKVARGESTLDAVAMREVFSWIKGGGEKPQELIDTLTVQERRVLDLVAEGKTNKEIANMMALSDSTVKNYLARVFEKLGVTRRAGAAALVTKALAEKRELAFGDAP